MNILIADLLAAAGPVVVAGVNALPEGTRLEVAEALERGGWCEIRVGLMNQAATVRLMLCNLDGKAVELGKIDFAPG